MSHRCLHVEFEGWEVQKAAFRAIPPCLCHTPQTGPQPAGLFPAFPLKMGEDSHPKNNLERHLEEPCLDLPRWRPDSSGLVWPGHLGSFFSLCSISPEKPQCDPKAEETFPTLFHVFVGIFFLYNRVTRPARALCRGGFQDHQGLHEVSALVRPHLNSGALTS